ncbi:hypothetical protein [Paenibacillus monticola]|nr:hypothetical protein [Paenibacillus monticola]
MKEELNQTLQELFDVQNALDESAILAKTDEEGNITYVNDLFG